LNSAGKVNEKTKKIKIVELQRGGGLKLGLIGFVFGESALKLGLIGFDWVCLGLFCRRL